MWSLLHKQDNTTKNGDHTVMLWYVTWAQWTSLFDFWNENVWFSLLPVWKSRETRESGVPFNICDSSPLADDFFKVKIWSKTCLRDEARIHASWVPKVFILRFPKKSETLLVSWIKMKRNVNWDWNRTDALILKSLVSSVPWIYGKDILVCDAP